MQKRIIQSKEDEEFLNTNRPAKYTKKRVRANAPRLALTEFIREIRVIRGSKLLVFVFLIAFDLRVFRWLPFLLIYRIFMLKRA